MALYLISNNSQATATAPPGVTTGTSLKTLLQLKTNQAAVYTKGMSTIRIKEWGISFDGSAAATPIKCELIETDGAATVTALSVYDIVKFDNYYSPDPALTYSTITSGFSSSNEGTITGSRLFDLQFVAPTNQYVKQFPLGLEPVLTIERFLRIRVTAGTAVNAYCYVLIEV